MTTTRFGGNVQVAGNLAVGGELTGLTRAKLQQDSLQVYPILPTAWRVHDALQSNLPGAGASDDLGLIGGTFGTGIPSLQTGDVKAAGSTTRYARCQFRLPPEFVTAGQVRIVASAGMLTTVADTTATIDFSAYKSDRAGAVDGADLVSTAAQSINSLTLGDKTFSIDGSGLAPGDLLDVRVAIATNDAATGTAVIAILAQCEFLLDIKG